MPKLFLIEMTEKEEEFPEISLNAITQTPSPKTMRIVGFLQFSQVIILIDFGSTHNFIDIKLAGTLEIQPMGQDGIKVQIADGQEIASPG